MAAAAPASKVPGVPQANSVPVPFNKTKAENGEQWTVESLSRTCNEDGTYGLWKYHVNTYKEGTDPYYCEYGVTDSSNSPASKTDITEEDTVSCADIFYITQCYNDEGYTVIVPIHPDTGRRMYAGFDGYKYTNGHTAADKTFPVHEQGSNSYNRSFETDFGGSFCLLTILPIINLISLIKCCFIFRALVVISVW